MIPQHDFLALTRRHEWQLDPFAFDLANGTRVSVWDTGVLCLEPTGTSPSGRKDIVLSCGIHGNETAPIEICNQLLTRLLSGEIQACHRVLFLFGNPAAMNQGVREVEENMNRLFSGAHSKGEGLCNRERIRAMRLEQYVSRFFADSGRPRYHYDLHTAIRGSRHEKFAVYPFPHERPHCKEQVRFLGACGVRTLVIQSRTGGALVSALQDIARSLEERKQLRREARTASSGSVFGGYLVIGLGVGSVVIANLMSPGVIDELAGSFLGRLVILAAFSLFAIGFVLMRLITRVDL